MSKVRPPGRRPLRAGGRRPGREEIKELRKEKKRAEKALRAKQKAEGLKILKRPSTPNRKSEYKSVEEEQEARQFAATEQARVFRAQLPILLKRLSKIEDPWNPKNISPGAPKGAPKRDSTGMSFQLTSGKCLRKR